MLNGTPPHVMLVYSPLQEAMGTKWRLKLRWMTAPKLVSTCSGRVHCSLRCSRTVTLLEWKHRELSWAIGQLLSCHWYRVSCVRYEWPFCDWSVFRQMAGVYAVLCQGGEGWTRTWLGPSLRSC